MLSTFKCIIVSVCLVTCACDPWISLWKQECKVHADSSHAETKKLIQEQEKFNVYNWSHWGIVVLLSIAGLFTIIGCVYVYCQVSPIIKVATKIKKTRHPLPTYSSHQSRFQPPYNAQHSQAPPAQWMEKEQATTVGDNYNV